jgi:hypothetical protein
MHLSCYCSRLASFTNDIFISDILLKADRHLVIRCCQLTRNCRAEFMANANFSYGRNFAALIALVLPYDSAVKD